MEFKFVGNSFHTSLTVVTWFLKTVQYVIRSSGAYHQSYTVLRHKAHNVGP